MQHRGLQHIIACSNDDSRVTLANFTARSNLVTKVFLWEKVKTVGFSETIAASYLKVSRSSHLIEYIKVCFEGQGHSLTLAQGRVHTKIQTGFSQKLLCVSEPIFL